MGKEFDSAADGPPEPRGPVRKWIALGLLAVLCGLTWKTIDPGKIRSVVLAVLLLIALRILLTASSPR